MTLSNRRTRHTLLLLAVLTLAAAPALHAQGSAGMRIESWTRRDSEMELGLAFSGEFGRRYRIEASTNLVLGYPVSGFYDQSSLMNDEEMGFELSSLSQ